MFGKVFFTNPPYGAKSWITRAEPRAAVTGSWPVGDAVETPETTNPEAEEANTAAGSK